MLVKEYSYFHILNAPRSDQISHCDINALLACVASVSNRVIARKLEREKKKVGRGRGRGEEETLACKPKILENAP